MTQSLLPVLIITYLACFHNIKAQSTTSIVSKSGEGCTYEKYEGGDGTTNISPIPTIHAVVPTCVLAELMGADANAFFQRADLVANGMMHFTNAVKGFTSAMQVAAPMLAPVLGLLGVGLGFIKSLTAVTPADIIEKVNDAIDALVEQTNQRLLQLQNYVDEEIRRNFQELMRDFYKGDFEAWNDCLNNANRDLIDDCQRRITPTIKRHRLLYMFQDRFANDPTGEMTLQDIKMLEIQLPILKQQSELHLLALGTLLKTYQDGRGEGGMEQYRIYKQDYIAMAEAYIAYMEWGYNRVLDARVNDQRTPRVNNNICRSYQDNVIHATMALPVYAYITRSSRECTFTCTTLRRAFDCKIKSRMTCPSHRCITMNNWQYYSLAPYHRQVDSKAQNEMNTVCNNYISSLRRDVTNFFEKTVNYYIPTIRESIERVQATPEPEDDSDKRSKLPSRKGKQGVQPKPSPEQKEEMEKEKALLKNTNTNQPLAEYFKQVMVNARKEKAEVKKKNKKKEKKTLQ